MIESASCARNCTKRSSRVDLVSATGDEKATSTAPVLYRSKFGEKIRGNRMRPTVNICQYSESDPRAKLCKSRAQISEKTDKTATRVSPRVEAVAELLDK